MKLEIQHVRDIIRLLHTTDYSQRRIGKIVQVSHNSVSHYARLIARSELSHPEAETLNDSELENRLMQTRDRDQEKQMPDWAEIHQRLRKNKHLSLIVIWEEYRALYKDQAYSYSQFTYYYREYVGKIDLSMRLRHYPGEAMFVDYAGKTVPWRNRENGNREEQAQVFIAVLGYSSLTFAWASRSQSSEDWIEAHNQAFQFIGGVPEAVVPDNLKAAVTTAGSNLVLNRTYSEMARYYQCVILPARVRKPQDKAKAEQGVLFATRWIIARLRERTFYSIAEINQAIAELLPTLNQRPLRNYPGCRQSRFEEGDQQALRPLPESPFEFAVWEPAQKVGRDYHVKVLGHWYSVPFHLVAEKVEARISFNMVELFHQHKRVASHQRSREEGGFTTDRGHLAPPHLAYANQDLAGFLAWAQPYGPATEAVIRAQFDSHHEQSMIARNACNNLKKLARLYEPEEFESACARAEAIASLTIKSVTSILRTGLHKLAGDDKPPVPLPSHANVRGAHYYAQGGH